VLCIFFFWVKLVYTDAIFLANSYALNEKVKHLAHVSEVHCSLVAVLKWYKAYFWLQVIKFNYFVHASVILLEGKKSTLTS
jgi:hypothetical protein